MAFGSKSELRVFTNDTATLTATLYDEDGEYLVDATDIANVVFTVRKPSDPKTAPSIVNQPGDIVADGVAEFTVPGSITVDPGQYLAIAQFTLVDGRKKSVVVDFDVEDPFEDVGAMAADNAIDMAWDMLEDCFDSELGGPWLRDMTLARFDKSKMRKFLPQVFLDINSVQPQTDFNEATFPYATNDLEAILSQGVLVATIRHLMRSYTEQPNPTGTPVPFFDKQQYAQKWKFIYDIEEEKFRKWLAMYKLRLYNLGRPSMLVGQKAGRMGYGMLRARGPYGRYGGW